ncbi:chondroitin sulfate proteoglycan 4-like [Aplochiton taeniatus]
MVVAGSGGLGGGGGGGGGGGADGATVRAVGLRLRMVVVAVGTGAELARVRSASFYGDGYVHLRTVEESSRTLLHVRFRTHSPAGLLFLAAGETDYLLLELHAGRLQVWCDLGSGQRSLRSEKGLYLNDQAWHSAQLHHDHHNVTLTVDRHSLTSLRMPGPDLELSVQDGLFVGGSAGLDRPYFSGHNHSGFRGCVDEVVFNRHNLLSSLRPYSGYKSVHEVSLGCSSQFSATEEDTIRFFSSRAFVALPTWDVPQEGLFECEMHSSVQTGDGVVLYSSAHQGGFVAMEIREGWLVTAVGNGGGNKTELRSLMYFHSNHSWLPVRLHLLPHSVHLSVGEETVSAGLGPHIHALQLRGPLFLGGVDERGRGEVRRAGLLVAGSGGRGGGGGSFKGCLRAIRVNGRTNGLPHATVTKDVSVGCGPEKVLELATTASSTDPHHFDHTTSPPLHGHHDGHHGHNRKTPPNFLVLQDLHVTEGGIAPLEPKHIKINLEFRRLGIRQSQLMFRIEQPPVHGQLRLDVRSHRGGTTDKEVEDQEEQQQEEEQEDEWTFSMMDLWHGRIMYVHGGSEDRQDFFMFSVFTSSKKALPLYLKGNRLHRFNVSVSPVNNAPELSLPEGGLFVLPEKSRRQLTCDVLHVADPDSNSTQLVFSSMGDLNTEAGHLEHQDHPGRPITRFSQMDLEEGKISFVHSGASTSRLALRVSDGEKVSNTVILRVMAVALEHKLTNNTGLEVDQGGAFTITTNQLAVQVNVADRIFEVRYDVTEGPRYGELQRLHSSGEWKPTPYFSQKLLEKERIRYLNTFHGIQTHADATDHFKCHVSIGSAATEEVAVHIKVRWIHFKVTRSKMEVNGVRKTTVTSQDLHAISKGVKLPERELFFSLLSLPKKGHLLFNHQTLKINSTFSQQNISDNQVKYELVSRPHEDSRDVFTFQVFSRHGRSGSSDFRISIKASSHTVTFVNKGLSILEGESRVIDSEALFARTGNSHKPVHYTVVKGPKHGKIRKIDLANSTSVYDHIREFTSQDVVNERVVYVHDDSETTQDSFTFHAAVAKPHNGSHPTEEDASGEHTFKISIHLVNDKKPIRVVDKVFHVARDGQRLLTLDDLRYRDDDSDFDDDWLVYTRRGIPMGELVLVNDTNHKLYQFTQHDLAQKKVLFLHRGVSYGRFVLFVSDGKHYVSTLLEVLAQDPYLHIGNNTGLSLPKGGTAPLTTSNLSVVTNLDIRGEQEVTYEVFLPPRHGVLFLDDGGVGGTTRDTVSRFTQHDLREGHLKYHHGNGEHPSDGFNVTARVREREGPSDGGTRREVRLDLGVGVKPLHNFTQEDVNLGLVHYQNQELGGTDDSFLLDATNGVTEVGPIRINVEIIPRLIPLEVSDMTVLEGASTPLTPDSIKVTHSHFSALNLIYYVSKPPHNGHIEHIRIPGVPIPSFSHTQVEHEYIVYVHDGSETRTDNFTIVANATNSSKHSAPCTMLVHVTPVNDRTPVVTVNNVLRVWVGSVTEISVDNLSAEDDDTDPDGLEFIVTPPSNGHLALRSAPARHILNFTQSHILTGQLVFCHSGALLGGFHFQVNDGVNFAPRQIFSTTARSLVLTLERNQPLAVYPGTMTAVTSGDLLVVTNDNSEHFGGNYSVVFVVTTPPKLGQLVRKLDDGSSVPCSVFTQTMINQGVIWYNQSLPESVGWSATDSFSFTVSCPPALLPIHTFTIPISYQHLVAGRGRTILLANTGAVVAEGGLVVIDKSKLDASNLLGKLPEAQRSSHQAWYRVTTFPRHGNLFVGDHILSSGESEFSHFALNKYGVTYNHDDSETTSDGFIFEAWLGPLGLSLQQGTQLPPLEDNYLQDNHLVMETFNVTVTPVNDQQPRHGPVVPSLRIAVGGTLVLGPETLHVEDLDTPPEELHYTVMSKPSNGILFLGNKREPVSAFTQHDVNCQRLHFVQQGEPSTGVFYFSVTDGHHQPLYKLLNLEVNEASVSMANNTGLSLVQGKVAVVLTTNELAAQTNLHHDAKITYTVTRSPHHGRIAIDDHDVTAFHHEDLLSGRVVYHMKDVAQSEDSFEVSVTAWSPGVWYQNLTGQTVNVTVRPWCYLREHVRVPDGVAVKLRRDMLDATELAKFSGVDPVFEILSPPKHGHLVKMTLAHNQASQEVKSFTFRDLVQGRVAIEESLILSNKTRNRHHGNKTGSHGHAPARPLEDSFTFLLRAGNVQPAKGELHFTIVPHTQMHHGHSSPNSEGNKGHHEHKDHTTPRGPGRNRTTTAGSGKRAHTQSTHSHSGATNVALHPHTHPHTTHKSHNKTLHKFKPRHHLTNHTGHGVTAGGRGRGGEHHVSPTSTVPHHPHPVGEHAPPHRPRAPPDRVESLPRPAADPLLIILPFLACLFLITILVVVILAFRHREKQGLAQELASGPVPPGGRPYLGPPERSVAMPSVVVTQLGPGGFPDSAVQRLSLAPGMTVWGPMEPDGRVRVAALIEAGIRASHRSRNPTLKDNQYWV